jgi:hypothetical protein
MRLTVMAIHGEPRGAVVCSLQHGLCCQEALYRCQWISSPLSKQEQYMTYTNIKMIEISYKIIDIT